MEERNARFTEADLAEARKYRTRSGIITAIAVAMYIVCWLPLVICGVVAENTGANVETWGVVGLVIMVVMVAAATAMLIVNSYMRPICLKGEKIVFVVSDDDDGDDDDGGEEVPKGDKSTVQIGVHGAIWAIALAVFLCIGAVWGYWHPGWITFIVAAAVNRVTDVIFEIVRKKRDNNENK